MTYTPSQIDRLERDLKSQDATPDEIAEIKKKYGITVGGKAESQSERGLLSSMALSPIEALILRPSKRFGEAVGEMKTELFDGWEGRARLDARDAQRQASGKTSEKAGPFQVADVLPMDKGGARQIAGEQMEAGSYLTGGYAARATAQATKAGVQAGMANMSVRAGTQAARPGVLKTMGEGAASGGLGASGFTMQDPNSTGQDIAQSAAIGTGLGMALGGLTSKVVTGSEIRRQVGFEKTRLALSEKMAQMNPRDYDSLFEKQVQELNTEFFNTKDGRDFLKNIGERIALKTGEEIDAVGGLRFLTKRGLLPFVANNAGDFKWVTDYLNKQGDHVMNGLRTIARRPDVAKRMTDLNAVEARLLADIDNLGMVGTREANKKAIQSFFRNWKQKAKKDGSGTSLSPEQMIDFVQEINVLRGNVKSNDITTSNLYAAISKSLRDREMANLFGDMKVQRPNGDTIDLYNRTNQEYGSIQNARELAQNLHNRTGNNELLVHKLGSLAGAMTLGSASAIGFAVTGGGSLVIAGIFAVLGATLTSSIWRQARFTPEKRQILLDGFKKHREVNNEDVLSMLLKEAKGEDKKTIQSMIDELDAITPSRGTGINPNLTERGAEWVMNNKGKATAIGAAAGVVGFGSSF